MINVVEIFYSLQGEGLYTGRPSFFIRLFGCNFECKGFDNIDSDGNIGDIPIRQVDSIEELSNDDFTKGCDSRYSWHKDYKHLAKQMTATEIVDKCVSQLPIGVKPDLVDFVFTGGEPMMNQKALLEIFKVIHERGYAYERTITIETNASLPIKRELVEFLNSEMGSTRIHFSNSPKMKASGEPRGKAWSFKALSSQMKVHSMERSFKFVVGTQTDVTEVGLYLAKMQELLEIGGPDEWLDPDNEHIYLMPVGATQEQQTAILPQVAEWCMQHAYSLSMRCHVYAFGNELGT